MKKIIFERVKDPNVIGYKIFGKIGNKTYELGTVKNVNKENPVKINFTPTDDNIVTLTSMYIAYKVRHKSLITNMQDGVTARINGSEISNSIVGLNKEMQTIIIYTTVTDDDEVNITYHIDGIEYVYDGEEVYDKFLVKAVFDESNITIGKHYKLT